MTKKAAPAPADPGAAQNISTVPNPAGQEIRVHIKLDAVPPERLLLWLNAKRAGRELTEAEKGIIFGIDLETLKSVEIVAPSIDEKAIESVLSSLTPEQRQLAAWNAATEEKQLALPGFFDDPYKKMFWGTASETILGINTRGELENREKTHYISEGGSPVSLSPRKDRPEDLQPMPLPPGEFGTSTKKLYLACCALLTAQTGYRERGRNNIIYLDVSEYAKACGEKVIPQKCKTPEELEKEKARIKAVSGNFSKQLRQDVNFLWSLSFGYPSSDGDGARLLASTSYSKGVWRLNFNTDFVDSVSSHLTEFPLALLKVPNRNLNSLPVLLQMSYHYSMYSNARRGVNSRLAVKTLLSYAVQLQTYEEMKEKKTNRNWKLRIKAVLEDILKDGIECGYLSRWAYYDGERELTPDQAAERTYFQWENLVIEYTPAQDVPGLYQKILCAPEATQTKKKDNTKRKKE